MQRKRTLSWRTKLLIMLIVLSVTPMVVVAAYSFEILVDTYEASSLQGLEALARAKAEALDQFTDYRRRDVDRIANLLAPYLSRLSEAEAALEAMEKPEEEKKKPQKLPALKDAEDLELSDIPQKRIEKKEAPEAKEDEEERKARAAKGTASPKDKAKEAAKAALANLKQTLGFILWDQKEFEELLVIDKSGRVVASTFEGHEGRTAESLDYFQSGLRATYVQPVFHSPITEQLTTVIATPIRNETLKTMGVLAARLNLKGFFRLINDSTGLGKSGETVVAKKIQEQVVFMAPTRHDDAAALERTIPIGADVEKALQEAARGQSGSGEEIDYRGERTLAAWQFVPSLDWGLVVKMDRTEVLEGVARARDRTMVLTVVILLICVAAGVLTARALVEPLRKLKEATDRISRGDFAVELDIRSNDEFGELADSFERMVAAIRFFREYSRREDAEEPGDEPDRHEDLTPT